MRIAVLRLLFALFCLALVPGARADTPIALFKSFAGNVNFVGTQRTLRTDSNSVAPCSIISPSTNTTATISGIPTGAKILSAQLYWAGSGTTADYTVTFEGKSITSPTSRQYKSATVGYDFFSGAYDATAEVTAKRNGSYSFSGLTVSNAAKWCDVQAVLGGWALLVVYSLPTETFRVLNLYEGFQYIQYSSISLTLSNFEIPPLTTQTGRIAHITWEGDSTLGSSGSGEYLLFNGTAMTDSLNPSGNQFNSSSNINNDSSSYGIDFDAYSVANPIIKAGQTDATTVYRSDQDLVLMSAEVIAVPNTPVTDLGITIARDQALTLGQTVLYTINVTNYGPAAEPGTIVVTDTLPANLSLVYVGGDSWSCSQSGQTVTCNYNTPLDVGAAAPSLYLTAMVATMPSGSITNTVNVTGSEFDNQMSNNTASDTASVTVPPYVFTNASCANAKAFGTAGQCGFIDWGRYVAGDSVGPMYVTLLNASGVPTIQSATLPTPVSLRFGLSCQNPVSNAGEQATFPDTSSALPLCAGSSAQPSGTQLSALRVFSVPANSPSISTPMYFNYYDVGRTKLFMIDSGGKVGASGPMVMKPYTIDMDIYKKVGAVKTTNPAASLPTDAAFVAAGEPFTIDVRVRTRDKVSGTPYYAKNFGNEISAQTVDFTSGAANDPGTGAPFVEMVDVPNLNGTLGAFSSGLSTGQFSFNEVGIMTATSSVSGGDYLGAGSVTPYTRKIGRFTPDHFDTTVPAPVAAGPVTPCSSRQTCEADVDGMIYSLRDFITTVTAFAADGSTTQNYTGRFARLIYLCSALDQTLAVANECPVSVAVPASTGNNLRAGTGASVAAPNIAAANVTSGVATLAVNYMLPNPFDRATPRTSGQTAPQRIYVRATDADGVSSLLGSVSTRTLQEGTLKLVNGRLYLPNVFGSELSYLPLTATAQFWNGTTWATNEQDGSTQLDTTTMSFAACSKALAASPCKAGVLAVSGPTVKTFVNGSGRVVLKAPGVGNVGGADFYLGKPLWLPSVKARATFGVYRNSPVTYIREIY